MKEGLKKYTNRVRYLTECNLKAQNIVIEDRFINNVDHVFPIRKGYQLGIPAELIASIDNLQIMNWKANREKGSNVTTGIPSAILEYMIDNDIYI